MKNVIFIISVLILMTSTKLLSQNFDGSFCARDSYVTQKFYKGNKILIPCDTVWIMNSSTYLLYKSVYDSRKNISKSIKITQRKYDRRLKVKDREYNFLLTKFDSLYTGSIQFVNSTNAHIESISASLDKANVSLDLAQKNLELAQELIKKERWNALGNKFLWGAGGAGIGILLGVLASN